MATHSLITLSNSVATRITPNGLHSGMDVTIQNVDDSAYVYIGGTGVTSSDYGYRIAPGHAISFELPGRDNLFAITNTNNSEIAVLKTNLEVGT
jgi:molybdopterin biosynthesis enzyme MoaB